MGGDRWTGALLATPAPIMAKLVWDRLPQLAVHLSDVAQGPPLLEARDHTPKDLKKAPPTGRTPVLSSASGARLWAIWLWNVPPQQRFKPVQRELRECGPNPLPAPATTANNRSPAFPP